MTGAALVDDPVAARLAAAAPPPSQGEHGRGRKRRAETYRAILASARAVLLERGYADATVEEIAARAGCGKQTIYRWWPGKAALYLDLYEILAEPALFERDSGDPRDDPRHLLRGLFALYRDSGIGAALGGLLGAMTSDTALAARIRGGFVQRRLALLRGLLERARARGQIRADADIALAAEMLAGAIWFRLQTDPDRVTPDFADALWDALLRGLEP